MQCDQLSAMYMLLIHGWPMTSWSKCFLLLWLAETCNISHSPRLFTSCVIKCNPDDRKHWLKIPRSVCAALLSKPLSCWYWTGYLLLVHQQDTAGILSSGVVADSWTAGFILLTWVSAFTPWCPVQTFVNNSAQEMLTKLTLSRHCKLWSSIWPGQLIICLQHHVTTVLTVTSIRVVKCNLLRNRCATLTCHYVFFWHKSCRIFSSCWSESVDTSPQVENTPQ